MSLYFLDTYALFELFKGSENYNRFQNDVAIITTSLNLMEFYYILLRINAANPDKYYDRLVKFVVNVSHEVIKEAARFRFERKEKDLSYVDALGYAVSKQRNAKFVTGDQQFKGMENVEFIK